MKRTIVLILSCIALHSSWGPELKWLCNPVLSCHSCSLAWFACPIGVFVHYSGYHMFPFIALGTVSAIGALVGRLLCGWVCPFGFLQDLLYKIPTPKFEMPAWTANFKYLVLLLLVFLFPFLWGEQTWFSFCRICPAAALQVSLPSAIMNGIADISWATLIRFAFLGGFLWLAIYSSRSFCKTFCPIGAFLAPFNYISFWLVKPPRQACLSCLKCDKTCSVNIMPSLRLSRQIPPNRHLDCIVCHDCQDACSSTIKPLANGSSSPKKTQ